MWIQKIGFHIILYIKEVFNGDLLGKIITVQIFEFIFYIFIIL